MGDMNKYIWYAIHILVVVMLFRIYNKLSSCCNKPNATCSSLVDCRMKGINPETQSWYNE